MTWNAVKLPTTVFSYAGLVLAAAVARITVWYTTQRGKCHATHEHAASTARRQYDFSNTPTAPPRY